MASFTKRDGNWRVQIYHHGVRESATFPTKGQAQAWASRRETELREQKGRGLVSGKTLGDAFRDYEIKISRHKRGHRWEALRMNAMAECLVDGKKMGEILLADLSAAHIAGWRDDRLKVVVGATVNRDMNLLSNVLTVARKEWNWIGESPTKEVRRPKDSPPRDRRISADEIDRLCLSLGFAADEPVTMKTQAVAVAFLFAIETAMRAGEICGLTAAMVVGKVAHLPGSLTKNGLKRDVPLSNRARELLTMLPAPEDGRPLFGLSSASLGALFWKAKARCLIDDVTFHDTRHEAITRLAKKLQVLDLARMVGHRDLRMLQIYYNETAADMADRLD
jgi:integrase